MSNALPSPVLATAVAHEIKATGSKIWLLQKSDYGLVMRCETGSTQFRLILPPVGGGTVDVPVEGKIPTPTHIVKSLAGLRLWLRQFQK